MYYISRLGFTKNTKRKLMAWFTSTKYQVEYSFHTVTVRRV